MFCSRKIRPRPNDCGHIPTFSSFTPSLRACEATNGSRGAYADNDRRTRAPLEKRVKKFVTVTQESRATRSGTSRLLVGSVARSNGRDNERALQNVGVAGLTARRYFTGDA
jgi:hypothetical protein